LIVSTVFDFFFRGMLASDPSDPELSSALGRNARRHALSKAVVCAIRTTILRTLKTRIPTHTISMTIEEIGIRKSAENSLPTNRSAVSTPSPITETISAADDTAPQEEEMTKPAAVRGAQGGWRRTADDEIGAANDPHDDRQP
jgi:hypothetical protein